MELEIRRHHLLTLQPGSVSITHQTLETERVTCQQKKRACHGGLKEMLHQHWVLDRKLRHTPKSQPSSYRRHAGVWRTQRTCPRSWSDVSEDNSGPFSLSAAPKPKNDLESRRVSLGAHWVDSRESSLLRRLERGREIRRFR